MIDVILQIFYRNIVQSRDPVIVLVYNVLDYNRHIPLIYYCVLSRSISHCTLTMVDRSIDINTVYGCNFRGNFWFPVEQNIIFFPPVFSCTREITHSEQFLTYVQCPDKNRPIVSEIVFRAIKHTNTALFPLTCSSISVFPVTQ